MEAEQRLIAGSARLLAGPSEIDLSDGARPPDARAAQIAALGRRIQARRVQRGITLDALATRTGFSKGYLSRIENGKKTPPLDTLARIAQALGTELNLLLAGDGEASADAGPFFSVVRSHGRQPVQRADSAPAYAFEQLAAAAQPLQMQPYLVRLPREFDALPRSQHEGQEFMYVLRGRVQWELGSELLELEPGDALYLDSRMPHRVRAVDGEAEALLVVTPRRAAPRAAGETANRADG